MSHVSRLLMFLTFLVGSWGCESGPEDEQPDGPDVPSCGWVGWPTVGDLVEAEPLSPPGDEESESELYQIADTLLSSEPTEGWIPQTGVLEIEDWKLVDEWPDDPGPPGCALLSSAVGLESMSGLADLEVSAYPVTQESQPPEGGDGSGLPWELATVLDSPWTGKFALWTTVPPLSHGTVVVRLGHNDSLAEHDARVGALLWDAGWAQVVVQARLYSSGDEDGVTRYFLRRGGSLLSVRFAETALAGSWAREQEWGQGLPLGLLGHSGGGIYACLLIRLFEEFDFAVTDLCYSPALPGEHGSVGDDYHPALSPYTELLPDSDGLVTPMLLVDYGYGDYWGAVITDWIETVTSPS